MKKGTAEVQGTVRRKPVSLRLGFSGDDYGYAIDLGLPVPSGSLFSRDPEIKVETVWNSETLGRSTVMADRHGPLVRIRGESGSWRDVATHLPPWDSMMTHCADPASAPELLHLRERMRAWRFYDQLRTDRDAPVRRPQVGTFTPVLAGDGCDLAAAVQTILEIGDEKALADAVEDGFKGARIEVVAGDGYFELQMQQHGLLRPLKATELSDGTLRYLILIAALLSPRPPEFMVLNEPEASLHPDLLPALARLIARAAERSQIVVVSHAPALVSAVESEVGIETKMIVLEKQLGETVIRDRESPAWNWPTR
jgi:predicted ATPase